MISLFLGRFQPFHRGHHGVVTRLLQQGTVVIGIGSSQRSNSLENPLSYCGRTQVIRACFPKIPIFRVPDIPHDDGAWTRSLRMLPWDVAYSGNPIVLAVFKKHGVPHVKVELELPSIWNGRHIRTAILNNEPWRDLVPPCALAKLDEFDFEGQVRRAERQYSPQAP